MAGVFHNFFTITFYAINRVKKPFFESLLQVASPPWLPVFLPAQETSKNRAQGREILLGSPTALPTVPFQARLSDTETPEFSCLSGQLYKSCPGRPSPSYLRSFYGILKTLSRHAHIGGWPWICRYRLFVHEYDKIRINRLLNHARDGTALPS